MLIELTHPTPNYEFWIETDDIVLMERYNKPRSIIIQSNDDKPDVTAIVMKNGKIVSCKETPKQLMNLVKGNVLND